MESRPPLPISYTASFQKMKGVIFAKERQSSRKASGMMSSTKFAKLSAG